MNNLNVLLLDDEKEIHTLIKKYFDGIYEIYSAYSYNDGYKLLKSKPDGFFKIFIIDINLQGRETGLDFIENYLNTCKTIVLSGYINSDVINMLINIGIFAAFGKPTNFGELFISMNSIIRCENV